MKNHTIGIQQANKCMQFSAIAYNLKKYLKFIEKRTKSGAASLQDVRFGLKAIIQHILTIYPSFNLALGLFTLLRAYGIL